MNRLGLSFSLMLALTGARCTMVPDQRRDAGADAATADAPPDARFDAGSSDAGHVGADASESAVPDRADSAMFDADPDARRTPDAIAVDADLVGDDARVPIDVGAAGDSASSIDAADPAVTDARLDTPMPEVSLADAGAPVDAGAIVPPRPRAPLSTSAVTSQRPTLRWGLEAPADGVRVELCRDRAMMRGCLAPIDAAGASIRLVAPLEPGWWFWRLRGRAGATLGLDASPVWQFRVGARSADMDRDLSWGTELDLNGDGFADVAVGSPNVSTVSVFYGSISGVNGTADVTLTGRGGDQFGFSVASAGDVNGDGYADLLVGADRSTRTGFFPGAASLFLGGPSGVGTSPVRVFEGVADSGHFGRSVASAGDVNGDGYADLVIGADTVTVGGRMTAGIVSVFHGGPTGPSPVADRLLEGRTAFDQFGFSVAGAGDLNGDGFADVVIGTNSASPGGRMEAGTAHVFYGSPTGIGASAAIILEGEFTGDRFGIPVASAGDVNGDGFADLVIGAFGSDPGGRAEAGAANLFLGGTVGVGPSPAIVLEGRSPGDSFGRCAIGARDLNGDGFADLLVGAHAASPGGLRDAGIASVFHGSRTGPAPLAAVNLQGTTAGIAFGFSGAGPGDLNNDGFADLLVGAVGAAPGGRAGAGVVNVYPGSTTGVGRTPSRVLEGAVSSGQFGYSIAARANGRAHEAGRYRAPPFNTRRLDGVSSRALRCGR